VSIQRDSLGRFMNLWEIPAEAVIYSWAKESMRSRSGPRLFTLHWEYARNTSTKCAWRIGWIIQLSGNQKRF